MSGVEELTWTSEHQTILKVGHDLHVALHEFSIE